MKTQLYFLENILLPLLDMATNNLVKVYFCDGIHLIYGYECGKLWSQKRICIKSSYGRKRVNCLGFLDAGSFQVETIMNDSYLNADSVCEGLKNLRKNNYDERIYVILDNAAYQRCKKVKEFAADMNINLIFLPPYSPNLNLIERLWKFRHKKIHSNKYYCSFTDFFNTVKYFLKHIHQNFYDELSSLLSFKFQCLDSCLCSI